ASEPRSDFFVRALAVVGCAGLLHLGLAHGLLGLLLAGGPAGVPDGRVVVSLAVLATLLAQLGALVLRSQDGDPADVVRAVPNALRVGAPVGTLLLGLLLLPPALLEGDAVRLAVALAPAAAAVWSAAHLVAIPATRVLHALAIRTPGGRTPRTGAPPPRVRHDVPRILAEAALAAVLVVLGSIAHHLGQDPTLHATMLVPAVGLLAFPVLAAVAGASLGRVPGQDLASVARRLDAPPPTADADPGTATPIVVTRHDEVGELLANLEALRRRLDEDLHRFESVLEQAQAAERIKADFLS